MRKRGGSGWAAFDRQHPRQLPIPISNNINESLTSTLPNNNISHQPNESPTPTLRTNISNPPDENAAFSSSVPIEPEWEDDDSDDIYLSRRKQALRAVRLASKHSKAATKAFERGDHSSARKHSLQSRSDYSRAHTLHSEAASRIFNSMNPNNNDDFDLDLHGLHASEALSFLQQHLHRIRAQSSSSLRRKMPNSINVITGVGKHSGGEATLPTAVRGFLNENSYHFEEFKPGVINIRLKFHTSN